MQLTQKDEEKSFYENIKKIRNDISEGDLIKIQSLIDEVIKYDVFDFIARVSSLNLLIENQNKSILFDALIAGLLTNNRTIFTGTAKMSCGKFKKIIRKLETMNLKLLVDPSENAFIERVLYFGNHWILPGINYFPSYTLQGFIDILCCHDLRFDEKFVQQFHQLINFILKISDYIVCSMGYNLESIKNVNQNEIYIPDSKLAETMKNCVCLDYSLIKTLIPDEQLRKNLFVEFENKELIQVIKYEIQDFFCSPFLKAKDDIVIILNPSILASFAVHQLVLLADSYGVKDKLINAFNNEIWKKCRIDLRNLGHYKIKESVYGIDLIDNPSRKEAILVVGNNKLLFIHFLCDSGEEYDRHSMFGRQTLSIDPPSISDRMEYFIKNISVLDRENVYQIVILNSFGRSIKVKVSQQHHILFLSPFELHCIAVNEQHDDFLPRYIDAKKKLNMIPSPLLSELNIIESYVSNNYSFYISDDFDTKTVAVFWGLENSLDYIIRAIKKEDRQLVEYFDGEHFCEVILKDSQRKIYCLANREEKYVKFLLKFDYCNIWVTTAKWSSIEELHGYLPIVDAISYWLAEAKAILNRIMFPYQTMCLQIVILSSLEEGHKKLTDEFTISDFISYNHAGNTIQMILQSQAYQLFVKKEYDAEKEMIESLIYELEKISNIQMNIDKKYIDGLFANPLKRKIYIVNLATSPSFAPPTGGMQTILEEEENRLLDEIGEYFLSLPEYDYGKVLDKDRENLANKVVGYLYSILQAEIALIKPDGIYEKVCFDLETVMYHVILIQSTFAYNKACHPEKSEEIIKQYNMASKTSIALKFLAEYIASTPPKGNNSLGSMQYDRILAICSLIIDWAYKNDLFKYNIFNAPIEFLKSGRIGMSKSEIDYLSQVNGIARNQQLEIFSDPRIPTYDPVNLINDFKNKIDEAFADEYGFTFDQFTQCIFAISDYGDKIEDDVKRVPQQIIFKEVSKQTLISIDIIEKIINQISLCQRSDFLVPPKPYKTYDVFPWRFNRDLSFTRRPIIQYNGDLIWGNRQLRHMWRYTVDLIMTGKYKARKPKLKQLIGKLSNKRGNDFNAAVAKKISLVEGLIVCEKLSKINGKRITDENNNVLGDIDVLYIVPKNMKIVVGEVKDFSIAKNPYEMNQEYKRIFVDEDKPSYLTKHKRRVEWVKNNIEDVKKHFSLVDGNWTVKSVMFVSEEIISNLFYHQKEKIIVYSNITKELLETV